ncbi:nucleic acid/nucleotide deaminase of polymorphic system toxin [Saccharothrix carnea]|uniref:Nucleic acid/nucleotide deaminase of polymorphic system toxin n=1 Tax=Saccharothrix carnea TaxID=1280637 RepID=A0A2P8ICG6_SACCR|nr:polymorphic toxin-type HINT domain-containing protein [Saccharothrix carnea]PSL56162.1 nucleic acid/nucleotide deaminase of polymorphic system toxin [Saccharothrix carnea]
MIGRGVARRAVCLAVVAVLAFPGVSLADTVAPGPLSPGSDYSSSLNARITELGARIESWPKREAELADRRAALDGRVSSYNERSRGVLSRLDENSRQIASHNATVAGYPNGAPPPVADALNAQATALNSTKQQLLAEVQAIASEGDAIKDQQRRLDEQKRGLDRERAELVAERQRLLSQMASVLQSLLGQLATPPTVSGGDAVRPPRVVDRAPGLDGGDPVAGGTRADALDAYARDNGVTVDKRPFTAVLTPDAVDGLTPDQAAGLELLGAFAGSVAKPDGNRTALYPVTAAPTPAQTAFREAVERGGRATAVVGGTKITVDEVEPVAVPAPPDRCPARNSFAPGTPVLLGDGTTRPIEHVRPGDHVRATDTATGRTAVKPVLAHITGTGWEHLTRVDVTDGSRTGTLTTTPGHPFWDPDRRSWFPAAALRPGQGLAAPPGAEAGVSVARNETRPAAPTVHNLAVADFHTYYVLAGPIAVLVHNLDCAQVDVASDELSTIAFEKRLASGLWDARRNVAVAEVRSPDGSTRIETEVSSGLAGERHAEARIVWKLRPDDVVLRLYSERAPCPDFCRFLLEEDDRVNGAVITYTIPYLSPHTVKGRAFNNSWTVILADQIAREKARRGLR